MAGEIQGDARLASVVVDLKAPTEVYYLGQRGGTFFLCPVEEDVSPDERHYIRKPDDDCA